MRTTLVNDSPAASAGSSGLERLASDVQPLADERREERREKGEEERKRGLTNAPLLEAVAPIAGTVSPRVGILALSAGEEAGKTAPEVMMMWELEVDEELGEIWTRRSIGNQSPMRSEEKEGQAVGRPGGPGAKRIDRVVIPVGGQNMTPGEISPGAQKSSQIFDSCPGRGRKMAFLKFSGETSDGKTMQCVLDWIRAGLHEDIGHKEGGYGWSGGMAWRGDRQQWCKEEAGGGCGGRFGKGGAERGFYWILQDFEEEGVAGQKLGGGAHQGQSGWSKATGATDFFKEAPDLERPMAVFKKWANVILTQKGLEFARNGDEEVRRPTNKNKKKSILESVSGRSSCVELQISLSQKISKFQKFSKNSKFSKFPTSPILSQKLIKLPYHQGSLATAVTAMKHRILGQNQRVPKSDIGPPPSPHSVIDQNFSPITTHSLDWMDVNNGFFEVCQYAKPCAFCISNHLVCCEATRPGSKKCEACRVVKGGQKVWCNPTTKSYGFEHPIQEVPTDNFDSGIRSVLKKAGIPTGGIHILSRERAKEVSATQHAKRQRVNPSKSVETTQANLNTVANGSSSEEDGDDEDGGIDRHGNTAETEDDEYCPPIEVPNPPRGESTIATAAKYPANHPVALTSRIVSPGVRGVTPGVDDLEPWVPEGSELESKGFTHDRRLAMALLVDTHYQLGQGIRELIQGNPTKRFMKLAAVSDQMELEMGSWLEHLELNGMVPYEAWDGSKGKGRDEGDPEE
ncbi:hypothetical protein PPACK8108_LOCUS2545 [Phakopsora pachyrhizi]|uniref:Uncharacterized protein n=1 Tax=Phakopsora pachyrhizi TaxID=170000 RepID=A0AAV0AI49_PHAPC|nr:hypothetical protein PPACK8108_LOCUS2545 [Phakopsora pachyrhizi]